jgi:hypothetical protein
MTETRAENPNPLAGTENRATGGSCEVSQMLPMSELVA